MSDKVTVVDQMGIVYRVPVSDLKGACKSANYDMISHETIIVTDVDGIEHTWCRDKIVYVGPGSEVIPTPC